MSAQVSCDQCKKPIDRFAEHFSLTYGFTQFFDQPVGPWDFCSWECLAVCAGNRGRIRPAKVVAE